MQTSLKKLSANEVQITVELDSAESAKMKAQALAKFQKEIKVDGFRPGKVPLEIISEKVGPRIILQKTQEEAIHSFLFLAIKQQNLVPLLPPLVQVIKESPLTFTVVFPVPPELDLGDYQKIQIASKPIEVSSAEVAETLANLRKINRTTKPVTGRSAAKNDQVVIDFAGFSAGRPVAGTSSKNHQLVLGEGNFIPGLEEGILGMQVGEEKEHSVKFPADFHNQDLADKEIQFKIKLQKIEQLELPELNSDFIRKISKGRCNSLEEVKKDLTQYLRAKKQEKEQERLESELLKKLLEIAKLEISPILIEAEIKSSTKRLQAQLEKRKITFEQFLRSIQKTEAEFKELEKAKATRNLKLHFILEQLAEREKIEISAEEVNREINKFKQLYPEEAAETAKRFQAGTTEYLSLQNKMRVIKIIQTFLKKCVK